MKMPDEAYIQLSDFEFNFTHYPAEPDVGILFPSTMATLVSVKAGAMILNRDQAVQIFSQDIVEDWEISGVEDYLD